MDFGEREFPALARLQVLLPQETADMNCQRSLTADKALAMMFFVCSRNEMRCNDLNCFDCDQV